jgi:hypothetical protein
VPEELHDFFELNYRFAADLLFAAAAETLKTFQKNNWKIDGGFLGVLHTWGSALNWHPHLHVLVSSGGRDRATGKWRQARDRYLFPVRLMSKVFRSIFLRELEALDARRGLRWPPGLDTVEARRHWRVVLCGRNWNIFSRATLGNTRAVVRYLARYTSRIAMSNSRIKAIDEERRTVTFESKDYRNGGRKQDITLPGAAFLHRFSRHLVPRGFRRVRSFGLLCGERCRHRKLPGAPQEAIGEKAAVLPPRGCSNCGSERCLVLRLPCRPGDARAATAMGMQLVVRERLARYSLVPPDSG